MRKLSLVWILFFAAGRLAAEDGYDLWLRYKPVDNKTLLASYKQGVSALYIIGNSPAIEAAKEELSNGLNGLLQTQPLFTNNIQRNGTLVIGKAGSSPVIAGTGWPDKLKQAGTEGYLIISKTINGKSKRTKWRLWRLGDFCS